MSDPVTNIEIEDVLSSIRRLVSDEARAAERNEKPLPFSSEVPPQAVEFEQENEDPLEGAVVQDPTPALVLTAALRIVPEQEEISGAHSSHKETAQDDVHSKSEALILTPGLAPQDDEQEHAEQESLIAEILGHGFADHEHEIANTDEQDEQDPIAQLNVPLPEEDYQDAPVVDAVDIEEDSVEEAVAEEPVTIEAKIAALEEIISRTDSDFEPDGAEEGGNAARPVQSLPWEDSSEQRKSAAASDTALPDPEMATQTAAFNEPNAAFERAHSEAVEAAQSELSADATETLVENEELSAILDEEALRDMVSEIVRQELQGPLGERITRNVRKLVRREIYRALAANELE